MTQGGHWRSPEAQAWRGLYKTARWQALRRAVLIRDGYQCQRCRVLLMQGRTSPRSAVVNHKTPHKGDRRLFFDPANCEAVCKKCHDSAIQSEEARGYSIEIGVDGLPIDPRHPANRVSV